MAYLLISNRFLGRRLELGTMMTTRGGVGRETAQGRIHGVTVLHRTPATKRDLHPAGSSPGSQKKKRDRPPGPWPSSPPSTNPLRVPHPRQSLAGGPRIICCHLSARRALQCSPRSPARGTSVDSSRHGERDRIRKFSPWLRLGS
jgi:hypothetical protein